jgi:hypothetical protein
MHGGQAGSRRRPSVSPPDEAPSSASPQQVVSSPRLAWSWQRPSWCSARSRSSSWTSSGFTVALGILLDTLIVRSVLVTALNLDFGRRIWWPNKLWLKRDVLDPVKEPERALIHD